MVTNNNNDSQYADSEPPVFICRGNDRNPMFGAMILGALWGQSESGQGVPGCSSRFLDKLAEYFPRCSFQRYHAGTNTEEYAPKGAVAPYELTITLSPHESGLILSDERSFKHLGYKIDPQQQQFNVLRGDLGTALSHVFFPYKIEKTYNINALPSTVQFLDDMYSSR